MCAITCCPCHLDLDKIKSIVRDARYFCTSCGHVAAEKDNLCTPEPIQ
jgi:hypothetical protein